MKRMVLLVVVVIVLGACPGVVSVAPSGEVGHPELAGVWVGERNGVQTTVQLKGDGSFSISAADTTTGMALVWKGFWQADATTITLDYDTGMAEVWSYRLVGDELAVTHARFGTLQLKR